VDQINKSIYFASPPNSSPTYDPGDKILPHEFLNNLCQLLKI